MERPIIRRKVLRFLFWALLLYTALSTTVVWAIQFGFIAVPPRAAVVAGPAKNTSSAAPSLSEVAFSEQFAREYLLWTHGKEESRAERLKLFWKPNLDVQGGLDFSKAGWDSYARNVDVWSIKDRPDQSGIKDVTIYAETILTNVNNPKEEKRVDRYLVVPIKKAGDSYIVVDIPHFIAPPVATVQDQSGDEPDQDQGEMVNDSTRRQVETFMKSFWKVYTTGEPNEIAYFRKDGQPASGLTGIMGFVDLKNLAVYRKDDTYHAECDVTLQDLASGAQLNYHYDFDLVQVGDRWYVSRMGQGEV
ncbi:MULTISPECIES: conjugal transfer protein [Thermoactinomyces]|jgi:hypothetical protein|uniref:Conjugal transfer protein n=1 Tax=Thermoactinomyces daqus TaxID=1329516 RepID=A0A7W1X8V2_9BACL|nr:MULTISPECIES: conjugal transfer protein [Thermoactinomyces]MBA4542152.1 conjugal transfer protein [Thermoactinomyces daqus]MBH8598995.1 conjugal transfer protein [Thermoactinomyces sp. CICC 10523]MBH8608421.1 conjugal transfer protein [Thermoactinomyces sp. CICC 10521]